MNDMSNENAIEIITDFLYCTRSERMEYIYPCSEKFKELHSALDLCVSLLKGCSEMEEKIFRKKELD